MSQIPMPPVHETAEPSQNHALMSPPAAIPVSMPVPPPAAPNGPRQPHAQHHSIKHEIPEAVSSLLRTVIVALFFLTFLAQPMVIPSESMEHTLLVGDFLLMNRATLAPPALWLKILP